MITWEAISAIATILGLIVGSVSAYLALRAQKENHAWNRKKTSEETLRGLVDGSFTNLIDEIQKTFDWQVAGNGKKYREVVESMEATRHTSLDSYLLRVLRILEIIAIHIKHGVIEEELCYEYLAAIGPHIYINTKDFIKEEREAREENRVFCEFSQLMEKWEKKNNTHKKII